MFFAGKEPALIKKSEAKTVIMNKFAVFAGQEPALINMSEAELQTNTDKHI